MQVNQFFDWVAVKKGEKGGSYGKDMIEKLLKKGEKIDNWIKFSGETEVPSEAEFNQKYNKKFPPKTWKAPHILNFEVW
jgi:hypothetical protein